MPIFDFYCNTSECPEKTTPEHSQEFLVDRADDSPECVSCKLPMTKVINYTPAGYVKGTSNPVKQ